MTLAPIQWPPPDTSARDWLLFGKNLLSDPERVVRDGFHLWEDESADECEPQEACRACLSGSTGPNSEGGAGEADSLIDEACEVLGFNPFYLNDRSTGQRLTPAQIAQVFDLALEMEAAS